MWHPNKHTPNLSALHPLHLQANKTKQEFSLDVALILLPTVFKLLECKKAFGPPQKQRRFFFILTKLADVWFICLTSRASQNKTVRSLLFAKMSALCGLVSARSSAWSSATV